MSLDVCPAIVRLPKPLSGAAQAAETTVGGSWMQRSISLKGKVASEAMMKRQLIIFIWALLAFIQHIGLLCS